MAHRRGIVDQLGTGQWKGYVRVRFPDRDNAQSWWLPVATGGTQGTKRWHMPEIGAQVALNMDEHDEDGCVIGEIWSTVDAPVSPATNTQERTDYSDGTSIVYDTATHTLATSIAAGGTGTIAVAGGASIVLGAGGTATLTDPSGAVLELLNNGTVAVTGVLAVSAAIRVNGTLVTVP
jgi:phage baseplate assembly protein V